MNSRQFILRETALLAIGEALCVAGMIGIFALMGYYETAVLLGGIIGGILAVGNFFFMAISADAAADKAVSNDVKGGKSMISSSFILRMLVIFAALIVFTKSGTANTLAMIFPLLLARPIITVVEFFRKSGEAKS